MSRGARRTAGYKGFDRWEYWWEYNKDRFLSRIPVGIASGTPRRGVKLTNPMDELRRESLLPALKTAAADDSEIIRAGAMLSLGKIGDLAALPELFRGTKDRSREVRKAAFLGLAYLGAEDTVDILRRTVADTREHPSVRAFAAAGLGLTGQPSAVEDLADVVRNVRESLDVRGASILALGLISTEESRTELFRVLANPRGNERLRALAANALGRHDDLGIVPPLVAALKDRSVDVRRSTAMALGAVRYRSAAQETLDRALEAQRRWIENDSLTDGTDGARTVLLATIRSLKERAQREEGRVEKVRRHAVRSLLAVVEREPDLQAKGFALVSLGEIGGPNALEAIRKILARSSHRLKSWAAIAAGVSGEEFLAPYLREEFLREGRDPSLRAAMAIGLGLLRDKASAQALADTALDRGEDPDLRGYSVLALSMMWDPRSGAVLDRILAKKGNPSLHRSAAIGLGLVGRSDSGGRLVGLMENSNDLFVKASATIAFGYLRDIRSARALAREAADPAKPFLARLFSVLAVGYLGDREKAPPLLSRYAWHYNYRVRITEVERITSLL
jgi:HEAT repeat protein